MKVFARVVGIVAGSVAGVFLVAIGIGFAIAALSATRTVAAEMHLRPNRARMVRPSLGYPPETYLPRGRTIARQGMTLLRMGSSLVAYVHVRDGELEFRAPPGAMAEVAVSGIEGTDPSAAPLYVFWQSGQAPAVLINPGWYYLTVSYSSGWREPGAVSVTESGKALTPYWPAGH